MISLHEKCIILAFALSLSLSLPFKSLVSWTRFCNLTLASNHNHPYWLFRANNILKLDSGSCWQKKHIFFNLYYAFSFFFSFFYKKGNKTHITLSSPKKKELSYVHSVNKDMYLKLVWADLFLLAKIPPTKEKLKTRKWTDFGGFQ